ncbi:MAG: hypothetical protein NTW59_00015, partial [Candidatus Diapherotrites archaeon]|nr:hypothetical protein [Candidatus Diapherotrites archaeon]
MRNSRYTTRTSESAGRRAAGRGVAVSIDALLAIALFISLLTTITIQPAEQAAVSVPKITVNQMVNDAMAALDNSGFIMQKIEETTSSEEMMQAMEAKLDGLLPQNISYRLDMKRYGAAITSACREQQTFATCFPDAPTTLFTSDASPPAEKESFHGKKIFIKKEPGDCALAGELAGEWKIKSLFLQGNHAPEARDVNIIVGDSCPGERNPCPGAGETMRCCFSYYDEDGNPQNGVEYKWYKYDSDAQGDKWTLTTQTNQTVALGMNDDGNRWKCSARVNDGAEWGQDSNSPLAIIG